MSILRSTFLTLAAIASLVDVPTPAQAQSYGGGMGYYGPSHHSGFFAGGSVPGGYTINNYYGSTLRVAPGYMNTYGMSTGYYGIGALGYGPSYGLGGYTPIIGAPNPVYGTSTTIIRGGPTGGVVQYTNNGNGYTYVPDSTYTTVIQQQPTLGLSRTIVPPNPPPVLIESRPPGAAVGPANSLSVPPSPAAKNAGTIKLVSPKSAGGPLTYSLNEHVYTIQPGFFQSFADDRNWAMEFKRGGEGSEVARYSLKAGTYTFAIGANGWELQQPGSAPISDLPPSPLPDLSSTPTPSSPPTPMPPP